MHMLCSQPRTSKCAGKDAYFFGQGVVSDGVGNLVKVVSVILRGGSGNLDDGNPGMH